MTGKKNLLLVKALLVAGAAILVWRAPDHSVYGDGRGMVKTETHAQSADEAPIITSARIKRKNLIVVGKNFSQGSQIFVDDNLTRTNMT